MAAAAGNSKVEERVLAICRMVEAGISSEGIHEKLSDLTIEQISGGINALLNAHKISMMMAPAGSPIFKATMQQDAVKFKGLHAEELLVYQCIKAGGNQGVWTRDLKQRTNLPQPKINKILKALEERSLVKAVKSVQNASRKMYMLAELEPAKEVTGGPWYGENAFDSEFIEALQKAAHKFIQQQGEATLQEIFEFISNLGLSKESLQVDDLSKIVSALELDGVVEEREGEGSGGESVFRETLMQPPTGTAFTALPCGRCPVIGECVEGGRISPATCVYYQQWLDF